MTNTERWILEAIDDYWTRHGFGPSLEAIGAIIGLRSKSGVHKAMHKLVDAGYVSRVPGIARSWRVERWPS
jgi:SOS-response transcriptional repressor LexA